MPRLVHAVPKYRKHRATGQAVVTVNGHDHYLGPHGSIASKVEYDRLIAEFLAAGRSLTFGQPVMNLTVVELCADYLTHAKAYYGTARTSEYHRIKALVRLLKVIYGRHLAAEFGPRQLRTFRETLIANGHCRTSINHSMRRLVRMFRWGVTEGHFPPAVSESLALVPALKRGRSAAHESAPILPVPDKTVEATLTHLSPIVGDMVRLQRLSGARPAEICALRPCDIDRSGEVWLYRPHTHKTQHLGRERTVYFGPKAQEILAPYMDRDAAACCFRPCDATAAHLASRRAARKTPLSCGNRPGTSRKLKPRKSPGDAYTVDSYRRAIHNACDKAFVHPDLGNVPARKLPAAERAQLKQWQSERRWSPNQLRHAAATEVRREYGLEAAQIFLGHAEASVTQIYAERDLKKGIEVAKEIG